jgi:hypothetical protein
MYGSGKGSLQPVFAFESFMKEGLDHMGPIKLPTHYIGNEYIIVAIDYTTKWVERKALRDNTNRDIMKFFYENIIT